METNAHITEIDRCNGLSDKEFYNLYVKNSLPVIVTDNAEWTTSDKFTPEYLISNYNHLTKTVKGTTYTLSEIIELCKASTPENKAPYPNIFDVRRDFPELLKYIPELKYDKSNRLQSPLLLDAFAKITNKQELFFGGWGCSFPTLHIDYLGVHTQLTQIIGEKDFFLFSPDQSSYFYPDKIDRNLNPVNIMDPDYEKYPLFKNAKALKITLKPIEVLFIPSGWWHTIYIHNFNLTYAIDHVNSFNWNLFMKEMYLSTKKNYPKLAWIVHVYKKVMARIFNIKEFIFD